MDRREFMALGSAAAIAPVSAMAESAIADSATAVGRVPSPAAAGLIPDTDGAYRVRSARPGASGEPAWLSVRPQTDTVRSGRSYAVEALLGDARRPVLIACGRDGERQSNDTRLLAAGPLTLRVTIGRGETEQVHELSLPVSEPSILAVPVRASAKRPVWRRCSVSSDLRMTDPLRNEPAPGCVLISFAPEHTQSNTTDSNNESGDTNHAF